MMIRIKLPILLFLLITFFEPIICFGEGNTDSLTITLKNAKNDSIRCDLLIGLITAENDLALASKYNNVLMRICSNNLNNNNPPKHTLLLFKKHYSWSLCIAAALEEQNNNIDKALDYYLKSLTLLQEINDKKTLSVVLNNIALIYSRRGLIQIAQDYNFKSLKLKKELNDKEGIGYSYNNIALIYSNLDELNLALEYCKKSLKTREEINDKNGLAESLINCGSIYMRQNNTSKAIEYFNKSLAISESINDKANIAWSLYHIGNIYFSAGNHIKALEYLKRSLIFSEDIANKYLISVNLNNIGQVYITQKKFPDALAYVLKSITLSQELGYPKEVAKAALRLYTIYKNTSNYKKALEYYEVYAQMKDSINNQENLKASIRSKLKFEYENKVTADSIKNIEEVKFRNAKLSEQSAQLKQERTQRLALYGGLVLVLIFSAFVFNRFKVTQKQKVIIEIKEKETQQQKQLIEEKHKEITDSITYAERIQRSFLATKELLSDNLAEYFVVFKPKDVVSGDFYWASKLSNNQFALVTADSTGHGVPGAIMSLLNITSLEKAIEVHNRPADILNATRKIIIERLKKDGSKEGGKDGMDCSLICFDFNKNKLIVTAANSPVWIVRSFVSSEKKEVIEIKPDKMPVGKHEKDNISFTQQEIELQKGDVIYTLTDGFPDQFGGLFGKKFMSKSLRELLSKNAHLPMQEQKALLETTFKDWVGDLEQVDDVTIIGIRV